MKKKNKCYLKDILIHLKNDSRFSIFEVIIIVFISILFGIIIGYIITYTNTNINLLRSSSGVKDIINTYDIILDNYYKKVDEDKLSQAAISGMINSLDDPNSLFMNSSATSEFNDYIDGEFVGIGVTVEYDGEYNRIIKVNKNSPAYKAGIKKDDLILNVDGKDCKGLYGKSLTKLIKGRKGTKVVLDIKRDNIEKTFTIVREVIEQENVYRKFLEYDDINVGYLKIDIFSDNIYKQFNKSLIKLEDKKINYLIIDLRDNAGGSLKETKKILSLFFDKNTVLYRLKSRDSSVKKIYSTTNINRDYPVIFLVNKSTASASEVMVSCFKDNYKNVTIIGEVTYGKGTVQRTKTLNSGTSVKYTTETWLTSRGKSINNKGIKPDYNIELDDSYYSNKSMDNDTQFQKAIEIIKKSR